MFPSVTAFITGAALYKVAFAQTCQVTTLQHEVPSSGGANILLKNFSYCGGSLNASAYVANLDYDKTITLFYTNAQGENTPLTSVTFGYDSSLANNYELWTTNTPVYFDGISQLLNITFAATDIAKTYNQQLNKSVTASGAPAPSLPAPPKPYATPKGFQDDITKFLAVHNESETRIALAKMFVNVNPNITGAAKGVIVAGRSGPFFESKMPDYGYNWARDSSLTYDVVRQLYGASTASRATKRYEDVLFKYATARATEQNDRSKFEG